MTREEIIEFCEMKSQLEPENEDVFNYIIEVLRKEPCEDCVSRQSVNELFDSEIKMYKERIETRKGSNYHDETERIKEFRSRIANAEYWQNKIKALPSVTPARKKGRWIKHYSKDGVLSRIECSVCHDWYANCITPPYCSS